ncbi:MAG: NifB/NifX family molybdenum-iron cluster-binding protein [Anaerolineae bacterium]|jgi:predicted Fe-Mo cluster-binding NifX family protein
MRVAVSADEDRGLDSPVSHHFGRCPYFVLADVDGEEIVGVSVIANPHFQQHRPGVVPTFIHNQGADVVVCGGMGWRAIESFTAHGVEPATGASGTARMAIERYLSGALRDAAPCRESIEHRHGEQGRGGPDHVQGGHGPGRHEGGREGRDIEDREQ